MSITSVLLKYEAVLTDNLTFEFSSSIKGSYN